MLCRYPLLQRIRSLRSYRKKVCSPGSQSTAEQSKRSNVHLELNHWFQANKWYNLTLLWFSLSLNHFTLTSPLTSSLFFCMCVCVREKWRLVHRTNHVNRAERHPVPVKCEKWSQAQHSAPRLPQQKHNMLALKDHAGRNSHPKEYHQLHYTVCCLFGLNIHQDNK